MLFRSRHRSDSDANEADKSTSADDTEENTAQYASRGLRKMSSDVSLSAINNISPTVTSPITPSLTTGASVVTTDDDEADFQSAYSTSPRGSYGSFEKFAIATEASDSDVATPTTIGKEYVDDYGNRKRASSTATAKARKGPYKTMENSVTVVTPSSPVDIR